MSCDRVQMNLPVKLKMTHLIGTEKPEDVQCEKKSVRGALKNEKGFYL